jgi:protein-L-isoaspartate(D-aspartate) O-methyltransferase
MIDVTRQRTSMVDSQVMPSDVTDRRIIKAMSELPRERFVPGPLAELAYMDGPVALTPPAPERRWLMAPRVLAKLLQLADLGAHDRVLDVGAATGYASAVLSTMARSVVAVESDETLAGAMKATLGALGIGNVTVVVGPLSEGCTSEAPYDVILMSGAIAERPQALLDQLKDGGRLVAVVEEGGVGKAVIWRRMGRSFDRWAAFDAATPPLPGFRPAQAFAL